LLGRQTRVAPGGEIRRPTSDRRVGRGGGRARHLVCPKRFLQLPHHCLLDNMNGLCAGLGAIGAGWFAVIAAAAGQYLVALIALVGAGALLGFLPFNFPQAGAFLGDAGSHLVGYLLAVLSILPHFYSRKNPE